MVLTDRDLDELWRKAGSYGGKIKESLEVAEDNERRSFTEITTKLFDEYRELKADFEKANVAYIKLREEYGREHQKFEQLASDTRKHMDTIFKLKEENARLNREAAEMQRQLTQRR